MPKGIYERKCTSDRFWSKVENSSGASCWQWLGIVDRYGYGRFYVKGEEKRTGAHRTAWLLCRGPVPKGMNVLHRCDNPGCVNPGHLFLGTQEDNMHDMDAKGRRGDINGEKNGLHKLTWDDIDWITVLANQAGWSTRVLAECNGLHRTAVWKILSGENWRR